MEIFVSLIIIVFGVLQIILFFKLWGMTNDVRELVEHFCRSRIADKQEAIKGEVNAAIVKDTGEQVEVISNTGDKYRCYNPETMLSDWYSKEELIFN